jgi:hypothetical protein
MEEPQRRMGDDLRAGKTVAEHLRGVQERERLGLEKVAEICKHVCCKSETGTSSSSNGTSNTVTNNANGSQQNVSQQNPALLSDADLTDRVWQIHGEFKKIAATIHNFRQFENEKDALAYLKFLSESLSRCGLSLGNTAMQAIDKIEQLGTAGKGIIRLAQTTGRVYKHVGSASKGRVKVEMSEKFKDFSLQTRSIRNQNLKL